MSLAKKRRARVASKSRSVKVWPRAMREASMKWAHKHRLEPGFRWHPASFEAGWKACARAKARVLAAAKRAWDSHRESHWDE